MEPLAIFRLVVIVCSFAYCCDSASITNEWTLRILHTNDMHARFDQTSVGSKECSPKQAQRGQCYGGFARLATLIRQARASTVPTIFLNAGDTYKGTKWFTAHRWTIVSKLLSLLSPDAISLGNHEFDDGPEGLAPFIENTTFPIVAANLDFSGEPILANTRIQKSVVLNTTDGHQIGVIGYLTNQTKSISTVGNVEFLDEVESIRAEANRLRNAGVNILIALGHSGFDVDKRIAAEVDGLDLVIGAHDNTFLYNGNAPSTEVPVGPYPFEIRGVGNRSVYVVQAYAYTKYLGDLTIKFNSLGEISNIQGQPILVDNNTVQAQDILDELKNNWQLAVDALNNEVVGITRVLLDGRKLFCRKNECNMGNLVLDAIIDYNVREYAGCDGWTDAAIALETSGVLQASIEPSFGKNVTRGDVLAVLPFKSGLVKMDLNGTTILRMLEHSVEFYNSSSTDPVGYFLHVSGVQVVYDLSKPVGSRAVSVLVRCAACQTPFYEPIDESKIYRVLTDDYIAKMGDGYSMLAGIPFTAAGITTDQIVVDYFKQHSPITIGTENRIQFLNRE